MKLPIVRATLLFAGLIMGGALLLIFDSYELSSHRINTCLLLGLMAAKVAYFLVALLRWISKTVASTYHLRYLISFLGLHVLLIVCSFGIDYFSLYRLNPASFHLATYPPDMPRQFLTFLYFSLGKFTTSGGGEIHPVSPAAQLCAMGEMVVSFFTTVLIIANVGLLQTLFGRKLPVK